MRNNKVVKEPEVYMNNNGRLAEIDYLIYTIIITKVEKIYNVKIYEQGITGPPIYYTHEKNVVQATFLALEYCYDKYAYKRESNR